MTKRSLAVFSLLICGAAGVALGWALHSRPPTTPTAPRMMPGTAPKGTTGVLSMQGPTVKKPQEAPLVRMGPLSFSPIIKNVLPAVVNIAITQDSESGLMKIPPQIRGTPLEKRYREKLRAKQEEILGAGSGFVIDASGVIVTNDHVVGDADDVTVSFSDGRERPARLIGADPMTDIAVIKVNSDKPLPYVTWGDSQKVDVGDWILVAGNPFGFGSSFTAGIVSARGRDLGAGSLDDFFQIDAPINPGNSGGPSFNLKGEVVAVNAAMVSPAGGSVGIGFGIPSNLVRPIVAEILRDGHVEHGWLGVTIDDGDGQLDIVSLVRRGPAGKGGLRKRDVILSVNGEKMESARSFLRLVAANKPGTILHLQLLRRGQHLGLDVLTGPRPPDTDQ
ncbi:trypsin-like peptidase domain-containing protein [Candidatus Kirkpatrickella diaphorinae]|uniref:Trypsin-like peptidase domain-containing protein n=1 Tax=Candidatus Kirkpatrickella diaphorinae TaxID=2984322 RepID=A0ABY6GJW9_9PROT|nr:trypsin-like peptidase domain-containing protein [Candidatus Kirkpatrickella diaphorinae]UYH51113.1 trypsin-like peptidase domain-containing protein [Candidatus Kirkpatrickella diaphorinae]